MKWNICLYLGVAFILSTAGLTRAQTQPATAPLLADDRPRILIFTKMTGYVHASVPGCLRNLRALCERNGIAVDSTADAGVFTEAALRQYRALVFLSNSGTLFKPEQRDAFVHYIHGGGGFVALHAASLAEPKWDWYRQLLGARFRTHPWVQNGTVTVVDPADPTVRGLPKTWTRSDEWYAFGPLEPGVQQLLQVGETRWHGDGIVEKGTKGGPIPPIDSPEAIVAPHAVAWRHEFEGGRAFYSAMGHFAQAYVEPEMQMFLMDGIRWAARLDAPDPYRILIFNKTAPKAYHDKGIPAATAALQALGPANGYIADIDSDGSSFTDEKLKQYKALVFLNVCGNHVLSDPQREALKQYIESGGGFVGIHAAADAEKDWPWFTGLVGAQLKQDKRFEPQTLTVSDANFPATLGLPRTFQHSDQWFKFVATPTDVHVLITADSTKFTGLDLSDPSYPVAWYHDYDGGRAFFTSLGHESSMTEPEFANHILGAISWAKGK